MSNAYDPNYVSQKVFAQVGQKAIILNGEDQILVMKRSNKTQASGKWSLPGGALEFKEDPFTGIQREIREETGLVIHKLDLFSARSRMSPENNFVVVLCYLGKTTHNDIELNWEHTDFKWVTVEEALKLNLSQDPQYFLKQFFNLF